MRAALVVVSGVALLLACSGLTDPGGPFSGAWRLDSATVPPLRVTTMILTQHGATVTGTGSAMGVDAPISITISGTADSAGAAGSPTVRLHLVVALGYQLTADITGTLTARDRLEGTALVTGLTGVPDSGVVSFFRIPPGSTLTTGLEGTVSRGPITPVCQVGIPCDAPFSAGFEVWQGTRLVTWFQSDSAGRYLVLLAPGDYTVALDSAAPIWPKGQTRAASVGPLGLTHLDLEFDTGIR